MYDWELKQYLDNIDKADESIRKRIEEEEAMHDQMLECAEVIEQASGLRNIETFEAKELVDNIETARRTIDHWLYLDLRDPISDENYKIIEKKLKEKWN